MTVETSKRVLLIANDMGGANVISASSAALSEAGCELHWCAGGPAHAAWLREGLAPVEAVAEASWIARHIVAVDPAMIVTGTSLGADLERLAWNMAHAAGTPSMAVVDARMNYRRRVTMTADDEMTLPDALGVIDSAMQRAAGEEGVAPQRFHVIGQPHLERIAAREAPVRLVANSGAPLRVAFLSENISERLKGDLWPGYDQFSVASLLLKALGGAGDLRLAILPHPSEDDAQWHAFLSDHDVPPNVVVQVGASHEDRFLRETAGMIGMATMMLVEAALMKAPVLSLQPGRKRVANPLIEECGIEVITTSDEVPGALNAFLQDLERPRQPLELAMAQNAIRRMVLAIETELEIARARRNHNGGKSAPSQKDDATNLDICMREPTIR